jgi:rfaE bifunctional protein kinase chain/domain
MRSAKPDSLRETLRALSGRRILVIGDAMLDEYVWGDVRRISPEAPVPVVEVRRRSFVPGGVANTAVNIASMGGTALLGGVIGDDPFGGTLKDLLVESGVDASGLISDPGRTTTTKSRIIAHSQHVVRVDCEHRHPLPSSVDERLLGWIEDQIPQVDAVVLSDYEKGVASPRLTQTLIRVARARNRPVVIDPKGSDLMKYRGASLIKPNLREAELLARVSISSETTLRDAGRQILRYLDGGAVLITQGSAGMTLFRDGSEAVHVPALTREVYDVTGAGDTVTAALALALAGGATLEQATNLANIAAGIAVSKVGTTAVTLDQLVEQIDTSAEREALGIR